MDNNEDTKFAHQHEKRKLKQFKLFQSFAHPLFKLILIEPSTKSNNSQSALHRFVRHILFDHHLMGEINDFFGQQPKYIQTT